jgi:hypothetical protein
VARVLIVDPDREITDLFAHSVKRLGHVPLQWDEATAVDGVDADVALVEPARPRQELGAVAHLDKPFERRELERALAAALAVEAA